MKRRTMLTLVLAGLMAVLSVSIFSLTGFGDSPENVVLDETLPVQLSSFTASALASGFVQLQWTAETETNMLGYNVYRHTEKTLTEARVVTNSIIPAHNSSVTTNYNFIDEDVTPGDQYYYWLQSMNLDLTNEFFGPLSITIEEEQGELPSVYVTSLQKNYPNPFNPNTTIGYSIREETDISLCIYNVQGQVVKTLAEGLQKEGNYSVNWDGSDNDGKEVTSGIYFYRLITNHYDNINKMLLIK